MNKQTLAERLEAWKKSKASNGSDSETINKGVISAVGKMPKRSSLSVALSTVKSSKEINDGKRKWKSMYIESGDKSNHDNLDNIEISLENNNENCAECENTHPNTPLQSRLSVAKRQEELASPVSSSKLHSMAMSEAIIVRLKSEDVRKCDLILSLEKKIADLEQELSAANTRQHEAENKSAVAIDVAYMATEEINSLRFENSIQEQRIGELEQYISKERLEQSENYLEKNRRHKLEIKKLVRERTEYQERANSMVAELNGQMAMLQTMAMERIEELETALMDERTAVSKLENKVQQLQQSSNNQKISTDNRSKVNRRQSFLVPMGQCSRFNSSNDNSDTEEEEEEENDDELAGDQENLLDDLDDSASNSFDEEEDMTMSRVDFSQSETTIDEMCDIDEDDEEGSDTEDDGDDE